MVKNMGLIRLYLKYEILESQEIKMYLMYHVLSDFIINKNLEEKENYQNLLVEN